MDRRDFFKRAGAVATGAAIFPGAVMSAAAPAYLSARNVGEMFAAIMNAPQKPVYWLVNKEIAEQIKAAAGTDEPHGIPVVEVDYMSELEGIH